MNKINLYILTIFCIFTSASFADKNMMIGSLGKIEEVNRTIKVIMYDNYYEPNSFNIKSGETIKFEVASVKYSAIKIRKYDYKIFFHFWFIFLNLIFFIFFHANLS